MMTVGKTTSYSVSTYMKKKINPKQELAFIKHLLSAGCSCGITPQLIIYNLCTQGVYKNILWERQKSKPGIMVVVV